jgi:hypothetical protein
MRHPAGQHSCANEVYPGDVSAAEGLVILVQLLLFCLLQSLFLLQFVRQVDDKFLLCLLTPADRSASDVWAWYQCRLRCDNRIHGSIRWS